MAAADTANIRETTRFQYKVRSFPDNAIGVA
jgi:hypothetical protein